MYPHFVILFLISHDGSIVLFSRLIKFMLLNKMQFVLNKLFHLVDCVSEKEWSLWANVPNSAKQVTTRGFL